MDTTSKLLLAAGLVTFGGALTGVLIGDADILQREGIGGAIPAPRHEAPAPSARFDRNLPSHYAIETPEGRFEVAELRMRGLDRNRGYSWYDRALAADLAAAEQEASRALMEARRSEAAFVPDPRFADAEWSRAGGNTETGRQPTKAERLASRSQEPVAQADTQAQVEVTKAQAVPAVTVTRVTPAEDASPQAEATKPTDDADLSTAQASSP